MNKVLIADDVLIDAQRLSDIVQSLGNTATITLSAIETRQLLAQQRFDLVICTHSFATDETQNLMQYVGDAYVIFTLPIGSGVDITVDAMNRGATHCFAKPLDEQQVQLNVQRLLTAKISQSPPPTHSNVAEFQTHSDTEKVEPITGMIGKSPAMLEVYRRIRKVGATRSTVLILGETGTGKELVARAVHQLSERHKKPFIAVNCAAIPETLIESELFGHEKGAFTGAAGKRIGLIEAAEGGSLFLDEIGELPPEAQARLLRFIQESEIRRVGSNESRRVDVRLIAATHRDLQTQTKSGGFRPDLYYRINVFRIFLPTLQQRNSDILEIADHLLSISAAKHSKKGLHFLPDAVEALSTYDWPGNVRELENVIERATIMCDDLAIHRHLLELEQDPAAKTIHFSSNSYSTAHTPAHTSTSSADASSHEYVNHLNTHRRITNQAPDPQEGLSLEDYFQHFVLEHQEQMNETELAKKLGISRKCLWERRQRLGIPRARSAAEVQSKPKK